MDSVFIFAQILGGIALCFGIAGYLQKDDSRLKLLMTLQCAALIPHFGMLGATTAMYVVMITCLRNFLAWKEVALKRVAPVFILFYAVFGLGTFETWYDLLPAFASIIATYGYFYAHGLKLRYCLVICSVGWIVHNIAVLSIGPLLMETVMLVSMIYTIRKMWREGDTA